MTDIRRVVTVAGHRITLTHLDKVLYPETGTTKAEVLAYYSRVAPALIRHAANRPATRKRWVHGVGTTEHPGAVFFQKNLEDGAPDWVERRPIQHSDRVIVYPLVNDLATLTWLAQLNALEIHVPQWQFAPDGTARNPDRLVLDLDPGEGVHLDECADIARFARRILNGMGLTPMPVTSGSKGLHLYAPLDGQYSAEQVVRVAHELARALEADHPDRVVSGMSKALRPGRVFVDWSQNSAAKTTIAPYSLRGRSRPTVAAPRTWAELDSPDLAQLEFGQVLERLARNGDPLVGPGSALDRLAEYRGKRRAGHTPEPIPPAEPGNGSGSRFGAGTSFVIQEHHARRLHWDLRLERDGVLVSWALPKGMPTRPAQNHLAVRTEDHPLEYGSFEGTIPAGEYGAGRIVMWDHGDYELEKWRDDEVIATLRGQPGGGLGAPRRVALIRTGRGADAGDPRAAKNWLIHLMKPGPAADGPRLSDVAPLPMPVSPMLATAGTLRDLRTEPGRDQGGAEWAFEMKWDGIRAIALIDAVGTARLLTRNGNDVTESYPEIVAGLAAAVRVPAGPQHPAGPQNSAGSGVSAILDGEIVALDRTGRPDFGRLQTRLNLGAAEARAAGSRVPVHYLLFDLLARNGRSLQDEPYDARRRALEDLVSGPVPADLAAVAAHIQVPPALDGSSDRALRTSRELGLEGIVAKRRSAAYAPGRRSRAWIKVKHTHTQEVVIGGWRTGAGNRAGQIGALLLGVPGAEGLVYVGRVGTGFSDRQRAAALTLLEPFRQAESPFRTVPPDSARDAHWVQPVLVGEVGFTEWTAAGRLRHPTWRGWRTDKRPIDVTREPGGSEPHDAEADAAPHDTDGSAAGRAAG